MQNLSGSPRRTRVVSIVVALSFFVISCGLVQAVDDLSSTPALNCILSFTLVANGGALPSVYAFVTNVAIMIVAMITVGMTSVDMSLFFIVCGFVFVVIASSSTQYYVRRR